MCKYRTDGILAGRRDCKVNKKFHAPGKISAAVLLPGAKVPRATEYAAEHCFTK